ncbi:PO21 protein, partial [Piaya cayana]|nr:PO21 protein [Piaya cayana]
NARQRGFIKSSGCSENLKLLHLLMKMAKRDHCLLAVVFIDIAKAFNTVSHKHLIEALKIRGVDEHIYTLINNLYNNTNTYIE